MENLPPSSFPTPASGSRGNLNDHRGVVVAVRVAIITEERCREGGIYTLYYTTHTHITHTAHRLVPTKSPHVHTFFPRVVASKQAGARRKRKENGFAVEKAPSPINQS